MGIGSKEKVLRKTFDEQNNAPGERNDSGKWRTLLNRHAKIFAINLAKIVCLFAFFYFIRNYLY